MFQPQRMKVLFLARSTLYSQPGGDTLQMQQTAAYLQQLGIEVDIRLRGQKAKPRDYDVVHFFNLFRPADLLPYLRKTKALVISTIYVNYGEYDGKYRGRQWSRAYSLLGKFGVEYLKTCLRWLKGKEKFPGWFYLLRGQKASVNKILNRADFCITASHQEARAIVKDFDDFNLKKYSKINLGCEHFEVKQNTLFPRKGVACAARIEGIKNQYRLISAMKDSETELHLFGNLAANQKSYGVACSREAGRNVKFHGHVPPEKLAEILPQFKAHAMPSFYETTGLSTIEALKAGCQVVITRRGGQEEIFEDHAFFCNPTSVHSIRKAIQKALASEEDHRKWAEESFSWEKAAKEISDIYRAVADPTN